MKSRVKIALLLGELINPLTEKRIKAERETAEVHLISWDRGMNMLERPSGDGYQVYSILLKAKSDPIRRLIPYIKFVRFAKEKLKNIAPSIIHAQNLDMLKIAVWYKEKIDSKVRIIYDIADLHKLLVDKQKSIVKIVAQKYLLALDRRCTKSIDLLIVTSEKFYEVYFSRFVPESKVLYMPNVPDLNVFAEYQHKVRDGNFVVGFIGAVRYKQQSKNLIEAGKSAGIQVLFAGVEYEPKEIEYISAKEEHVQWYGKFCFEKEAAKLYAMCDVIYSVYDADMENCKTALPNKLYESIWCEVPIIVAKNTYLAELVEKWGIGVAVSHKDIDELSQTLIRLRDDQALYNSMVQHCHDKKKALNLKENNTLLQYKIQQIVEQV